MRLVPNANRNGAARPIWAQGGGARFMVEIPTTDGLAPRALDFKRA